MARDAQAGDADGGDARRDRGGGEAGSSGEADGGGAASVRGGPRCNAGLTFVNMEPRIAACGRGTPAEHFWSAVDLHRDEHGQLLELLYREYGFFTYTVKLHRKDASADETRRIVAANARVVARFKEIELLSSTPLQFSPATD